MAAAPTLIWITDAEGRATFFNDVWLAFTGRSLTEELGDGWRAGIHPEDANDYLETECAARAARASYEIEYRLRDASGTYRWLLGRANPCLGDDGRFAGFVGTCVDISARRRTNEAMRLLADLSTELASSLEPERTLSALGRMLVPGFADWCMVEVVQPDGPIRRAAAQHRDAEGQALADQLAACADDRNGGRETIARVIAGDQPVLFADVTDDQLRTWARDDHELELLRRMDFGSGIAVPLIARGRNLGALLLSRGASSASYDSNDLGLAVEVARRAALAIDNAELFLESEQRKAGMRRANDALQFLADAGVELSRSLDYQETLASVARLAVPGFADVCLVDVAEPDGTLHRVATAAASPELEECARQLPNDAQGGTLAGDRLVERLRRGESIHVPDMSSVHLEAYARGQQHLEALTTLKAQSVLIVPLMARGHALGAVSFVRTRTNPEYDDAELAVAEQLGRRAGLSLENSRLYSETRRIEANLRHSNEVFRFVAGASAQMAGTLDYEESLQKLADLAVPRFADWCAVDILDSEGQLKRVAIAHKDPAMVELASELAKPHPIEISAAEGISRLLRTGESLLYPNISDEMIAASIHNEEDLQLVRRLGMKSAMAVALASRGRIFGSLTFMMSDGSHEYGEADLEMAEALARRVGVAIENAKLYTDARLREEQLVRANEAKDEFLGLMSHELRTPITVIHGGAQVLRSRGATLDDDSREAMLGDIERESERLARMLDNLLSLSRVELDQELSVEPVLVTRLIDRLVASLNRANHAHVIAVETEPNLPPVAADPGYVEHVVRNLLSNAAKYSPAGQPIEVRLSYDDGYVAVRVSDRGFGIAPEEAELIFERFYRSDRTAKLAGGAGLGLAVCKRLVEAMGGRIWAVPREGGGLEAGFTLPRYEEVEPEP